MRGPTAHDVLGRVTLVTGKEEFLNERSIVAVREAVRRHDVEAELSAARASMLEAFAPVAGDPVADELFTSETIDHYEEHLAGLRGLGTS